MSSVIWWCTRPPHNTPIAYQAPPQPITVTSLHAHTHTKLVTVAQKSTARSEERAAPMWKWVTLALREASILPQSTEKTATQQATHANAQTAPTPSHTHTHTHNFTHTRGHVREDLTFFNRAKSCKLIGLCVGGVKHTFHFRATAWWVSAPVSHRVCGYWGWWPDSVPSRVYLDARPLVCVEPHPCFAFTCSVGWCACVCVCGWRTNDTTLTAGAPTRAGLLVWLAVARKGTRWHGLLGYSL